MSTTAETFFGVHTALITPFTDDKINWEDAEKLVESQVSGGVNGIVAVGTTGESPTLDTPEHIDYIRFITEKTASRAKVIAGTGSNATDEAIKLTVAADKAGADAMLIVAPYYNKPSPEGLFKHFSAIAESTEKPIILYSIPSRCGIEISVDVCARLWEKYPHVLGIKEAGGSVDRVSRLYQKMGKEYLILSGDDSLTLPFMTAGAKGVISVASNLVPKVVSDMVKAALSGDYATAIEMNKTYYPLFKDLFIEPNPVPVKYAMQKAGLISCASVRPPLCNMEPDSIDTLNATLQSLGL